VTLDETPVHVDANKPVIL